ncbi:MAG: tetratricopeptide repeat protein [Planctomycetes bacterium]|nr:tetratricopeptide repeat protein [Planctomycetota bacterium]
MHAEIAYLFRHALMRDAAYGLQLPSDRARLHELAFHLIEQAFGGRAPEPQPLDSIEPEEFLQHSTDPVAGELAFHAGVALAAGQAISNENGGGLASLQRLYLRRAAETAERSYLNDAAITHWLAYAGLQAGAEEGHSLRRAGFVAHSVGRPSIAESLFVRARECSRAAGARLGEAIALGSLANVLRDTGRIEQAEDAYREALDLFGSQQRGPFAVTLSNRAALLHRTGRIEAARHGYEQALSIARIGGHTRSEGQILTKLAVLCSETGHVEEAETLYMQALDQHRQCGDRLSEATTLTNLGNLLRYSGRSERAESCYEQALAIQREVGNRPSVGVTLANLGLLRQHTNRVAAAEDALTRALEIHRDVGNVRFEGVALCNLAGLYLDTSRHQIARQLFEQALRIFRELRDPRFQGVVLGNLAGVFQTTGQAREAEDCYQSALEIFDETQDRNSKGIALGNLAGLYRETGRDSEALKLFEQAIPIHREIGNRFFEGTHTGDYALAMLSTRGVEARSTWLRGEAILFELGESRELQRNRNAMHQACAKAGVAPFDDVSA